MPRSEPFEAGTTGGSSGTRLTTAPNLRHSSGPGLEVGVGTGRFAAPLGVEIGLDPAGSAQAQTRGVEAVRGYAERLSFTHGGFRTVLVVETVCFGDDLRESLREARRALRTDGSLVLGYIDRDSPPVSRTSLGRSRTRSTGATFRTADEIPERLAGAGFNVERAVQTLSSDPLQDAVREGHGEGSFVGISATPD